MGWGEGELLPKSDKLLLSVSYYNIIALSELCCLLTKSDDRLVWCMGHPCLPLCGHVRTRVYDRDPQPARKPFWLGPHVGYRKDGTSRASASQIHFVAPSRGLLANFSRLWRTAVPHSSTPMELTQSDPPGTPQHQQGWQRATTWYDRVARGQSQVILPALLERCLS